MKQHVDRAKHDENNKNNENDEIKNCCEYITMSHMYQFCLRITFSLLCERAMMR
jgi:hypothetical protein